jgi:hypothetical protein
MIVRWAMFVALSASAAAASAQQPTPASSRVTPQARALFERDWVLMNWALKFFDGDHDQLLSQAEAEAAASEFRRMADSDGDGRVTPQEYNAARAAILARG